MNIKMQLSELTKKLGESEFNQIETLQVLKHNKLVFWSWGVSQLINFGNKGLGMKVSGNLHKGWVLITLSYMDTYSVHLVSNKGEVIKSFDMVYFDMLSELIDENIERIKSYVR